MPLIVTLFILYEALIVAFFYNEYKTIVETSHAKSIESVESSLKQVINTFRVSNDNFHMQYAPRLGWYMHEQQGASKERKESLRAQMLSEFMPFYNAKNLDSLDGFQIFDAQGRSFLRFHNISHHSDSLCTLRYSIKQMVQNYTYSQGFEIGRYKEAFRYQYPLFYDGKFVGAYEYSIAFGALLKEMKQIYAQQYLLLLDAKKLEQTIDPEIFKNRYETLDGLGYLYKKEPLHDSFHSSKLKSLLNERAFVEALELKQKRVIDYSFNRKSCRVALLPIYDIEKSEVGMMIVDAGEGPLAGLLNTTLIETALAMVLGSFIFILLAHQVKEKLYVRNLLNSQKELLIVTNGEKIQDANQTFLNFFGFKTLSDFQRLHDCICDFFIEEQGYLQKKMGELNWLEYIQKHLDQKHYVQMYDKELATIKIFEIEYDYSKEIDYNFIVFKNVTDFIREKSELQTLANHDPLTKIYNRQKFEESLKEKMKRIGLYPSLSLSLIMFDIDHFKEVNDTYGHDTGDMVLSELSALVSEHIRQGDVFARWGGEEFMIILDAPLQKALVFAQKLRTIIEKEDFKGISITSSFGVTQCRASDNFETLTKRCDKLLYKAKESGRNRVESE